VDARCISWRLGFRRGIKANKKKNKFNGQLLKFGCGFWVFVGFYTLKRRMFLVHTWYFQICVALKD
jgi:hypothetical protein